MNAKNPIPLSILEEITNEFSVKSRIGRGGYADVYKGVYNQREIAVKLLHVDTARGLGDQQFKAEIGNLLRVKHRNIVQLVGYCYETKKIYVERNGAGDFSEHIYRAICFEYLQGGSLDKHLDNQSFAPDWSTRYNIMKGICEGLNFLHKCKPPILHLDLKPANILLDSSMEPKVADLGLSRLCTQSNTHVTEKVIGTRKYMPPEFIEYRIISLKNDIFSLGVVMIEIMTGPAGCSNSFEIGNVAQLDQRVLTKWTTVIKATSKYPSDEKLQVQTCIELAIRCVDSNRDNRPSTTDILDAMNKTETNIPKRQLADELPFFTVVPTKTTNNTLKTLIAELENITIEHKHDNTTPRDSNSNVQQATDSRETASDVSEELIIGRTEEKQTIVATLSRSATPGMTVLPIYGIGGIGKTTLAQLVFNDPQFAGHSRVWVYVSQNLDLDKIGNSVISQLSEESPVDGKQIIHNRLRKLLAGKNILIVLDDVWEKNSAKIEKMKSMLRLGAGSMVKIIVTTRDEAIAREIRQTVEPYKLEPFSDEICWKIIKHKSAFKDRVDKRQLKHIGRDIATKCGGVALAAQSLGYMLKHMKYSEEWELVRDNNIWNISPSEDPSSDHEVLASLMLSYSYMPDWLKLCFSYCAVFRKGQHIAKYDLIHQWIALGFTEQSKLSSILLCEKYVTQLLGMSFLQYSKTQHLSHPWQDKDDTFFTMHDLVYDLAKAILAHQVYDEDNTGREKCRYAMLTEHSEPLQLSMTTPSNLKALHFLDYGALQLRGDVLSLTMCLCVLNLSECRIQKLTDYIGQLKSWRLYPPTNNPDKKVPSYITGFSKLSQCLIQKLPNSIGQLKNLRYLHATYIKDQMIPNCITELSKLNYLNLAGSHNISSLPESIGDMKGLMHLDLSGCVGIHELPISFGELKQLVHLNISYCSCSIAENFGGFTKLQYLNVSTQIGMNANRRGLTKVIGNLLKLRYLNLSGCMRVMLSAKDETGILLCAISSLSNLEHLDLSGNEIPSIPESMGNLRKLRLLDLLGCYPKKLPDSMVNMVSLKVLNVESMVKLDESVLSMLNIVSLPCFVVHASSDKCSSNIIRLQPTNPIKLKIDRLENVMSAQEAQGIQLIKKQKIEDLAFQWTARAGRFVDDKEVLEKLVPPCSVQILLIKGYINANLPAWLMNIRQYLPNLKKIYLCDFPYCNNLPPLGQLPNLQWLGLIRIEGLEDWNTEYSSVVEGVNERMFPKLERLYISQCPKLRTIRCPCGDPLLEIVDCDVELSSWTGGLSLLEESKVPLHQCRFLAFRYLEITGHGHLTLSPEGIKHLSSLQSLSLSHNNKAELPSWVVQLTSLQELRLILCDSMTSLPQSLGRLASLKRLEIFGYKRIRSLPDSIQQLTKLEDLSIYLCPELRKWCQSEDNKMKLAHIREVIIHHKRLFP